MRSRRLGSGDGPEIVYFEPNELDYKLSRDWRARMLNPARRMYRAVFARTVLTENDRETSAVIEARRRGPLRDVQHRN